ncbi:hypothetical protein ACN27J_00875 [Solwaraspora sp. WMMB762]|uniref:hypothetical protein n=1 Tax=Solwaraspora sp. WMMB762 TaxID=3404120 RepID=UPI003B9575EF
MRHHQFVPVDVAGPPPAVRRCLCPYRAGREPTLVHRDPGRKATISSAVCTARVAGRGVVDGIPAAVAVSGLWAHELVHELKVSDLASGR